MWRLVSVLTIVTVAAGAAFGQPITQSSNSYVPPLEIYGEKMDVWIKRLKHNDPAMREMAVRIVPAFGKDAAKAVPQMVDLLTDPDFAVRLAALYILSSNPIVDAKERFRIIKTIDGYMLYHSQTSVRIQAAWALARFKSEAAGSIPKFLGVEQIRNQNSYEVRQAACFALGQIAYNETTGPDNKAILALLHALSDDSMAVRGAAVDALINLGPPFDNPQLLAQEKSVLQQRRLTERTDPALGVWLRVAFMCIDKEARTPVNLKPIADELNNPKARIAAAMAIARMGKAAAPIIGSLRIGLALEKNSNPDDIDFCCWCLSTIAQLGPEARILIEDVKTLTTHKNENIQAWAREALESIERGKKLK